MRAQVPNSAFISEGRERVDPRHIVWNLFPLKLITLALGPLLWGGPRVFV
jgi:hypothetical protein